MNNKVIAGVTTLALLVTMTAGWSAYNGAFRIEVVVDTTIFLPDLNENELTSTIENTLEFHPSITGLNEVDAIAIDTEASGYIGDWSVEMAGNVPLKLKFKLDSAAPQGITVSIFGAIDNASPAATFTDNNELNLTDMDAVPLWAESILDGKVLQIWQRVGADTTAVGGVGYNRQIIVTSSTV